MHYVCRLVIALAALLAFGSAACGTPPPPEAPVTAIALDPDASLAVAGSEAGTGQAQPMPEPGAIPVTADDPISGSPMAPVTIVQFADFQCPFCRRASETLAQLRGEYGPDQLRIVFKHNPLPFHPEARPAAEYSMALYHLGGFEAFWEFHSAVYRYERLDERTLGKLMTGSGFGEGEITRAISEFARAKVERDISLAKELGALGTPSFFINGTALKGAQPVTAFHEIIDRELREARVAEQAGVPPEQIYAHRTQQNLAHAPPPDVQSPPPAPDDTTVHFVPVGGSPVRGNAAALVTIVVFSEFQCPFCAKALPTLEQLGKHYGNDLRLVFKHQPLPFHKRAEPAAELAIEVFKKQGNAGFWKAHDALFAQQKNLEDQDLADLARKLGLNPQSALAAVTGQKHKAVIEADQSLADDLDARGTPTFYINGRRLVGAQPREKFEALIDEELAKARDMVKAGTPAQKVYDAIMKDAARPPPPKTVNVPAPGTNNPSRGPKNAPVVVQVFADFQCPFCARAIPTLAELQKEFPTQVRVIFRHFPLPMHREAPLASAAAIEAFAQKGDAGFWKMHDLLFADINDLSRAALERHAASLGLDLAKFSRALDAGTHDAAISGDVDIAKAANITGTPAFAINGYFISGAQPIQSFRKLVQRALDDIKSGKKPAAVATP